MIGEAIYFGTNVARRFARYWAAALGTGALALAAAASLAAFPIAMKPLLDTIAHAGSAGSGELVGAARPLLLLALVWLTLSTVNSASITWLSARFGSSLQRALYQSWVGRAPTLEDDRIDVIDRFINDVAICRTGVTALLLGFPSSMAQFLISLMYMVYSNRSLTGIMISGALVGVLVLSSSEKRVIALSERVSREHASLCNHAIETLRNVRLLQRFNVGAIELATHRNLQNRVIRANLFRVLVAVSGRIALMACLAVTLLLMAFAAMRQVAAGQLSITQVSALLASGYLMGAAVLSAAEHLAAIARAASPFRRVTEQWPNVTADAVLGAAGLSDTSHDKSPEIVISGLEMTRAAPGGRAFKLSIGRLTIDLFRTVALVGASGSGKTTLANIISGEIVVRPGSVRLCGEAVSACQSAENPAIIYVEPQPTLFSRSIRENILLGRTVSPDQLRKACRTAGIMDASVNLWARVDDPVVSGTDSLSSGQRQRVGLARALLSSPTVLIIDEALGSLDGNSERSVMQQIRDEYPTLTCVVVSHRLSSVSQADRIIVIDDGEVVEDGRFSTLSEAGSRFEAIFRGQMRQL